MRHLFFNSGRRRAGGRCKLGPDLLPVIWTQVAARDLPAGGAFDGSAVLGFQHRAALAPIAQSRLTFANSLSKFAQATNTSNGSI